MCLTDFFQRNNLPQNFLWRPKILSQFQTKLSSCKIWSQVVGSHLVANFSCTDKLYFQIVAVLVWNFLCICDDCNSHTLIQQPLVIAWHCSNRTTISGRAVWKSIWFPLGQFISEVPFSKEGGKLDDNDVANIMKKKTVLLLSFSNRQQIFTTAKRFPFLTNRFKSSKQKLTDE